MTIKIDKDKRIFHLQTNTTSYLLQANEQGHLLHLYWGEKLETTFLDYYVSEIQRASYIADADGIPEYKLERLPVEYPSFGHPDLRSPAMTLKHRDGSRISDFRYVDYEVMKGHVAVSGQPCLTDEKAETLVITLMDAYQKLTMKQYYTVFVESDVMTRKVELVNEGSETVLIEQLNSACVELPHMNYDLVHLSGKWARERHLHRAPLTQNRQTVATRRGQSSHEHDPFIALVTPETTETTGEVYAMRLVYSGDYSATVDVDMQEALRLQIGLNPEQFEWNLKAGQSFITPEAVLVYTNGGLGKMGQVFQNTAQKHVVRGNFQYKERPVLINSWEAFYFDLKEKELLEFAKEAKELGVELFVLDDGWFGKRDDDSSSLGDWFVDKRKFPNGLRPFRDQIKDLGLQFGLWVEPEMVSPDSELFRAHPDWALEVTGRLRSLSRKQYVLDLTNPEVRDYLVNTFINLFKEVGVDYVKWDFNRSLTEAGSNYLPEEQQGEVYHRYVLGLYEIVEKITSAFPDVLFENCAGGGGRFDLGMTYYMPQTWTSDDTDAIERLAIQQGTSYLYPNASMGCHVSASPNHQNGRVTSLKTRGIVAMQGNFGYELDITNLTEEEKTEIKEQIALYKEIRPTVQFGTFTHLPTIEQDNAYAWQHADDRLVVVGYTQILSKANSPSKRLRLAGLPKQGRYKQKGTDKVYYGDELMRVGLQVERVTHDFYAQQWILEKQ